MYEKQSETKKVNGFYLKVLCHTGSTHGQLTSTDVQTASSFMAGFNWDQDQHIPWLGMPRTADEDPDCENINNEKSVKIFCNY